MEPASLLEEIRFGYGPRRDAPQAAGGVDVDRVLAQLTASDPQGAAWDQPRLAQRLSLIAAATTQKKTTGAVEVATGTALKQLVANDADTFLGRPTFAAAGFVERLVNLWSNRITVSNIGGKVTRFVVSFRDDAIRPHIGGRYADMVQAALWHPAMQSYLTQINSFGPQSEAGLRRNKGLNENLAREFLELHTMRDGYSQEDVTQLAWLLAGMMWDDKGMRVDPRRVQPGRKRVLGVVYDDSDPVGQINRMVQTIALRPETARNVAFTLARHFVADVPPEGLVDDLAATYLAQDSALTPLYRVLLSHPAARSPDRTKLRNPQEYAAASLRLTGLSPADAAWPKLARRFPLALTAMGQAPFKALRPDGWPEVAKGWMTPPMLAARVDWAIDISAQTTGQINPAAMVDTALGPHASALLKQSASRAEQRWEGLVVLIASPEFSRR